MVFLLIAAFIASPSAIATPLDDGRTALSQGKLPDALQILSPIDPSQSEYTDKIEALARYHLTRDEGLEAWRILQVGRRVRRAKPEWNDLERLAIFQSRACPLSLAASPASDARAHLLNAAVYRLRPAIFRDGNGGPDRAEPDDTHLARGLVPYLKAIPKTTLLANQGCRLPKALVNRKGLPSIELSELFAYLESGENSEGLADRVLILVRALELAANDAEKTARIEALLPPPASIAWRDLPDAERQWLFVHAFGGRSLPEIAEEKRAEAERIATMILETPDASPLWISMIQLNQLPLKTRIDLLAKVDAKGGSYKGRAWVLFELARARYEDGQTVSALTILRRLLVEREEPIDDSIEDASVTLASHVFTEYRLDKKIIGALDASLPSRLWRTMLTRTAMRAAIAARPSELNSIETLAARRNSTLDLELLKPLARRDLKRFQKELRYLNPEFARTLASYMVEEKALPSLAPYAAAAAERLRTVGNGPNAETDDLIRLLTTAKSEWAKGNASVRQGVVKVGVARRTRLDAAPASFALEPPATLPRRDLFFIPDPKTDHGWMFSKTKR